MASPKSSVSFWAPTAAGTDIAVGNVVLPDDDGRGTWVVATSANRGTRRAEAVATSSTSGSGLGSFELQHVGTIDASISGLSATESQSLVRCSSEGRIERIAAGDVDTTADDIIGYAEADGRVHLMFGLPLAELVTILGGGGATPGGTEGQFQAHGPGGTLVGVDRVTVDSGGDVELSGVRAVNGFFTDANGVSVEADGGFYNIVPGTIATDRTIMLPNLSANDSFVALAAAQTLTNKTINASNNTISNIANSHVSASAAIAGTKISPDFGAQNVVTTGSITVGGSNPAATGAGIRLPLQAGIYTRNFANTGDVPLFVTTSTESIEIGHPSGIGSVSIRGNGNFVVRESAHYLSNVAGTVNWLSVLSTGVKCGVPLAGDALGSVPLCLKSAAITQSSTTATTLTASQYECPILNVSGTPGGNFDVIAPNTADSVFWVRNTTANTLTIKKSGGTGVAIATNKAAMVWHNGTDYVRLTPDA